MISRLYDRYGRVIEWGGGLWLLSTLIGLGAAYFLKLETIPTIVMANDLTVALLIAPWFINSFLHQGTRPAAVQSLMTRAWQGASHEAVERDFKEIMEGGPWVGGFSTFAAALALAVLVLDVAFRLLFGFGSRIFPLLG